MGWRCVWSGRVEGSGKCLVFFDKEFSFFFGGGGGEYFTIN